MNTKQQVANYILDNINNKLIGYNELLNHQSNLGFSFAPSNIALVKYWGKSNQELNIPVTDSLSISLGDLGTHTRITLLEDKGLEDVVILNNKIIKSCTNNIEEDSFYKRIKEFLDLFRSYKFNNKFIYNYKFKIETTSNIPIAAGLASSASGFAALVLSLNNLFSWDLDRNYLSILARLGSGSACRSFWNGFVYWQKGENPNSLDCHGYHIEQSWQEILIGLVILSDQQKAISSRSAMQRTVETSVLYQKGWKSQVEQDLTLVKQAIKNKDFELLGTTAENNALAMHATMLSSKPAVCYYTKDTIEQMHRVWELRNKGTQIYFTQDAGPNLKLLFNKADTSTIKQYFNNINMVNTWDKSNE